jgi:hypothetical protein
MAKCPASVLRPQVQERQETGRMDSHIGHSDDDHFIINMYGLHNANTLRKALPQDLVAPVQLYSNRKAHHFSIAANLRVSQTAKRAITQAKRKATLAAKKAKKAAEQVVDRSENEDEDDEAPGGDDGTEHALGKRRRK